MTTRIGASLMLALLETGGCVGWHSFKYGGDGHQLHKGIVSRNYTSPPPRTFPRFSAKLW